MTTQEQIEYLLEVIEKKAIQAYESGEAFSGDELYDAYDVLDSWLRSGMKGEIPVEIENLIKDADELDAPPTIHEKNSRKVLDIESKAADKTRSANTLPKRTPNIDQDNFSLRQDAEYIDYPTKSVKRNLSRLQQKSGSERISDLDEALQIARELLSLPTLPEKEQQDIQKWELEARKKRAIIKSESGEIESMAGLGRLREAIERMEDFIKRGRYEFEDREGNIVPTAEKLREYNEEYAVFCTQKAREYLERANKSLPVYPMAAVEVLQFALREFSRADPLILEELELELQKAKELVIVADNVQGLISLALRFIKQPISRLEFLLAAKKQLDPKIVELDTLIEREQLDATAFLEESDRTIQSYLANEDINLALKIANEILELGQNIKGENKQLDESLCKIEQIVSRYKDYPHNFRPN